MTVKTMRHSTLYICVLVLMLLELISNCYPFDFQIFNKYQLGLSLFNSIVMGITYIGVIAIVDTFLKQDKYEYINLLGVSLLSLLFSCLLFHDVKFPENENLELITMIQFVINQIVSLIKMYIPILIVLCFENSKLKMKTSLLKEYRKPIAYTGICIIGAILQNDYRMVTSIALITIVCLILIQIFERMDTKQIH